MEILKTVNKVKTRNTGKKTTVTPLHFGNLYSERTNNLDIVVALSAVNHIFWLGGVEKYLKDRMYVYALISFIIIFFSYRLFKEKALSNFHSCIFFLQDLLQFCGC